jgi:hypothetical protein
MKGTASHRILLLTSHRYKPSDRTAIRRHPLRSTPRLSPLASVEHLRKLLNVASGDVVLTPARPRLVGLRPALRTVYVGRRPPSSIHHHPALPNSLPFEDRRQALSYPDAERRDAARGAGATHLVNQRRGQAGIRIDVLIPEKLLHDPRTCRFRVEKHRLETAVVSLGHRGSTPRPRARSQAGRDAGTC